MIRSYGVQAGRFTAFSDWRDPSTPAMWVDLLKPSREEEAEIERHYQLDLPTREEMQEIELSNRLYSEDGAHFMTANVLSHTDTDNVVVSQFTFVLKGERLFTVRYEEPRSVGTMIQRCEKSGVASAESLFVSLLEGFVERLADLLERTAHDLDVLSADVFVLNGPPAPATGKKKVRKAGAPRDYKPVLAEIGRKGDVLSKARDSLGSLQRLLIFFATVKPSGKEISARVKTLSRDVQSLSDHTSFVTQKTNFLLDATLGMINSEQNAIIKIFSVAAVVFLPPTLIASVYGMNFAHMPELAWPFGYPFAIFLMIASAALPYYLFKSKGWL